MKLFDVCNPTSSSTSKVIKYWLG